MRVSRGCCRGLPAILVGMVAIVGCRRAEPPDLSEVDAPFTGLNEAGSAFDAEAGSTLGGVETGSTVGGKPRTPGATDDRPEKKVATNNGLGAPVPSAWTETVKMVAIEIELPAPAFRGTPVPQKSRTSRSRWASRGRRSWLPKARSTWPAASRSPSATRRRPPASSTSSPTATRRPPTSATSSCGRAREWVQIDLGQKATIYAVLVWHNHAEARVYRDVIVQVSDDPDFLDAQTVFNNDYDNSSGLGIGDNWATSRPPRAS